MPQTTTDKSWLRYAVPLSLLLLLNIAGGVHLLRENAHEYGWWTATVRMVKGYISYMVYYLFMRLVYENYKASGDTERHIAEINVRSAVNAAVGSRIAFFMVAYIWATREIAVGGSDDTRDPFALANSPLYVHIVMVAAFAARLYHIGFGQEELAFIKYVLRHPWQFLWQPGTKSKLDQYSTEKTSTPTAPV